jgi:hypothetical protein
MSKLLPIGSLVDFASLRSQDLLPAFLELLRGIDDDFISETYCEMPYDAQFDDDHAFWEMEKCMWIMEHIEDRLNLYCPDGYYFGASQGNGSDFGVWECDDE